MIKLENLSKVYRTEEIESTALNQVSFEIEKGEFVSVMGPSGCGKSTLLNIIGMLDKPESGSYTFLGKEVSGLNEKGRSAVRKENIGFIVFLKDNIKEVDIIRLQKKLDATKYVKESQFISKESAAKMLQEDLGEDFIEFLGSI